MHNNETQNQDLHSAISEQMVELNENELDAVAGGDLGDFARAAGRAIGGLAGDLNSTPFEFAEGFGGGFLEGLS